MKSGKELERLIATLERVLAGRAATIEAPSRKLLDRDTGKPREHDVLLTWHHGHHQIITAIECRDRKRPVGVPDVEAFADKCDATGVHSGVIVSASGFRETARLKARVRSITCMDITEVEAFEWLGMDHIEGYSRHFSHMDVQVMFTERQPDAIAVIFDAEGNQLSESDLLRNLTHLVPHSENPETEVGRQNPVVMKVLTPGWIASDPDGIAWPIDHMYVTTSFTTKKNVSQLIRHKYIGGGRNYSLASARAPINNLEGSFVMLRDEEDGGTKIYWCPDISN